MDISNFTITKAAAERIAMLQKLEDAPFFRVSVDGGGCSGFQYKFDFDTQCHGEDLSFEAHGVTVLVDDMSIGFLQGAELDYVEELIGSYFKVENPNATASCGCGTSFSI
ncbi:MAG: iron-sulfur cluster insertion protein ErpA [Candidatus Puniceispirillaceae bacterium]